MSYNIRVYRLRTRFYLLDKFYALDYRANCVKIRVL